MSNLKGKVAIVTGASKGIGAGIAKALAEAGAAVVVNYASSKEGADRVVEEIARKDGRAIAVHGDVAKLAEVVHIFAETRRAFGAPSVLVNNAGVFRFEPLEAVTAEEFHRQFDINVLGSLLMTQEAAKQFGPEGGSVINISSVVATDGEPGAVVYAATKAAVDSLTRVLSRELGPRKIRVNSLSPGVTETEGTRATALFENGSADEMVSKTPLGRIGRPDDVGPVAVFLASDDAHWVTGESLRVAGGLR